MKLRLQYVPEGAAKLLLEERIKTNRVVSDRHRYNNEQLKGISPEVFLCKDYQNLYKKLFDLTKKRHIW